MSGFDEVLEQMLADDRRAGLERQLRPWSGRHGPAFVLDGRTVASFSSNNYLGLAEHPALVAAAADTAERLGTGSGASRLISGNHVEHEALERNLAQFHCRPAALLFNSGFQANIGVIPALVGKEDVVLSDQLNHASLIDGCRLSRARVAVYRHGDMEHLAKLLEQERAVARHALVVTESVFSMDGDRAALEQLAELCRDHGAWLMVDEAHAVGVYGPGGQGLCAEVGLEPEVLVGTLGKAFGSFGAYCAGKEALRRLLLQRARSFVFSTAMPPMLAAAGQASVALVSGPEGDARRRALLGRIEQLADGLTSRGLLQPGAGDTAIFPLLVGKESDALAASAALWEAGFHIQAIRPPTVPRGTSRLRVTLSATHTATQVDDLLTQLDRLLDQGLLHPTP